MYLFGEERNVVYKEDVDAGGMFDWTVGVVETDTGYRSFVQTGWGGGAMGPTKATQQEAHIDIERLMDKV